MTPDRTLHRRIYTFTVMSLTPEYDIRREKDDKGEWHPVKTLIGRRLTMQPGHLCFILGPDDEDFAKAGDTIKLTLQNEGSKSKNPYGPGDPAETEGT